MKALFTSILLVVSLVSTFAATEVFSLTNGTERVLLSSPKIIDNIAVLATTANNTTVKFYDAATATTNFVQAAYTRYTSYATNFTSTFTNSLGVLVTNTYAGVYRAPVAVGAATNEMTKITTIMVPASALLTRDTTIQTVKGLVALSDQDAVVTVTYRNPE